MGGKRWIYIAVIVLWIAAACADSGGHWAGTISDSAGVTMVLNPEEGMWGESEGWTVREELLIGSVDASPDYQFSLAYGIAVDSKGRIFVLDARERHVQVYSPDGAFERSIGRRGRGPGELEYAPYILMTPGDTLVALDMGNQRLQRFASDGRALESPSFSAADGVPLRVRGNSRGVMAVQLRRWAVAGQNPAEDRQDVIVVPGRDGKTRDTLLAFAPGRGERYTASGPPEYTIKAPEPSWDLTDANTLVFGTGADYRIEIRSLDGVLQRVVEKRYAPRPITARDRQGYLKSLRAAYGGSGSDQEIAAFLRQNVHFTEYLPPLETIVAGPAGTIWVQHVQAPSDLPDKEHEPLDATTDEGSPDWSVFDREGRYLGVVRMPDRFKPMVFRGEKIYGVWRDDLDVQYVLRLGIVTRARTSAADG